MRTGQLLQYNLRNIFFWKNTQNLVEKLFPDENWPDLWINILTFYIFYFYCLPSWGLSKVIETDLQTTCIYLMESFLKNKERSGTSLTVSFSSWFLKKNISPVIFYNLTKLECLIVVTSWGIEILWHVYCHCLLTMLWRNNFWNQPYLSNQAVFSTWPNSQEKNLNISRKKRAFKMK